MRQIPDVTWDVIVRALEEYAARRRAGMTVLPELDNAAKLVLGDSVLEPPCTDPCFYQGLVAPTAERSTTQFGLGGGGSVDDVMPVRPRDAMTIGPGDVGKLDDLLAQGTAHTLLPCPPHNVVAIPLPPASVPGASTPGV